jgi:hypothetical protein
MYSLNCFTTRPCYQVITGYNNTTKHYPHRIFCSLHPVHRDINTSCLPQLSFLTITSLCYSTAWSNNEDDQQQSQSEACKISIVLYTSNINWERNRNIAAAQLCVTTYHRRKYKKFSCILHHKIYAYSGIEFEAIGLEGITVPWGVTAQNIKPMHALLFAISGRKSCEFGTVLCFVILIYFALWWVTNTLIHTNAFVRRCIHRS